VKKQDTRYQSIELPATVKRNQNHSLAILVFHLFWLMPFNFLVPIKNEIFDREKNK